MMSSLFLATLLAFQDVPPTVESIRVGTIGGDYIQHLQWSPDGKKFLFSRLQGKTYALWTMNADGSDAKRLLPNENLPHFDGHWSPDSQKIVFVYVRFKGTDGELQIDLCNTD